MARELRDDTFPEDMEDETLTEEEEDYYSREADYRNY